MGYSHLSGDRFVLRFKRASGSEGKKQINAMGYDDETAIVVECKSREDSRQLPPFFEELGDELKATFDDKEVKATLLDRLLDESDGLRDGSD